MRSLERLVQTDAVVPGSLGWIGLAAATQASAPALAQAARAADARGVTDVVLLGMGGSSLAPLVLARVLGREGGPRLHVLDTTSPWTVLRTIERLWPEGTIVILSSKSGTTIEPLSLYAVFRAWADGVLGECARDRFVAVTDPGSPLEQMAREAGFAAVFPGRADVGGRFSALSAFGTVPAALIGVDIARLAASAAEMEASCSAPAETNPAASLAAWMADGLAEGRDKLTFVASKELAPFGLWVEQLVAESTGKNGLGVVPVLEASPGDPRAWADDRMVLVMRTTGDPELANIATRAPKGTPVLTIDIADPYDIGAEFVRWEYAVALLGHLMGVNPFDQPNVAEAKEATSAILAGTLAVPEPTMHLGDIAITTSIAMPAPTDTASLASALDALMGGAGPGDYLAVLAYLPEDREVMEPLTEAVASIAWGRRMACMLETGPRYLHSTGQLHKAGPPKGRFLIVTARDEATVSVPGAPYSLSELIRAQAAGDFVTLARRGLPVVRVDLPQPAHGPVRLLAETLRGAAIG
jgi:glucose-6-phosphate isomerase